MMDIDKMEAGPELNAKVATEIMEWKVAHDPLEDRDFYCKAGDDPEWTDFDYYVDEWDPSHDIAAAWLVLEKLEELDPRAIIRVSNGDSDSCDVDILPDGFSKLGSAHITIEEGTLADAPLAICRAAWKAVEEGQHE